MQPHSPRRAPAPRPATHLGPEARRGTHHHAPPGAQLQPAIGRDRKSAHACRRRHEAPLVLHRARRAGHLCRPPRRQPQALARQRVAAEVAVAPRTARKPSARGKTQRDPRRIGHCAAVELHHLPGLALQQQRGIAAAAAQHALLPAHLDGVRVRHPAHRVDADALEHQRLQLAAGARALVAAQTLRLHDQRRGGEGARGTVVGDQLQPLRADVEPPRRLIPDRAEQRLLRHPQALRLLDPGEAQQRGVALDPDAGARVVHRHHPHPRGAALGPQREHLAVDAEGGELAEVTAARPCARRSGTRSGAADRAPARARKGAGPGTGVVASTDAAGAARPSRPQPPARAARKVRPSKEDAFIARLRGEKGETGTTILEAGRLPRCHRLSPAVSLTPGACPAPACPTVLHLPPADASDSRLSSPRPSSRVRPRGSPSPPPLGLACSQRRIAMM